MNLSDILITRNITVVGRVRVKVNLKNIAFTTEMSY